LLESKIKKTTAKNRLGYGKGDRSWYPTLFGWEIGKRLAYFTTSHELSSLTRRQAVQKVQVVQTVQIVAPDLKPWEWIFDCPVDDRHMASRMPVSQVRRLLRKYP